MSFSRGSGGKQLEVITNSERTIPFTRLIKDFGVQAMRVPIFAQHNARASLLVAELQKKRDAITDEYLDTNAAFAIASDEYHKKTLLDIFGLEDHRQATAFLVALSKQYH